MYHYGVNQPVTLENLATEALGEWIASQAKTLLSLILELIKKNEAALAEDLISKQIENIRSYVEGNLPRQFHNGFATLAIEALHWATTCNSCYEDLILEIAPDSQFNAVGRMIEALFTESLTSLTLYDYSKYNGMFLPALRLKPYMLSGLNTLDIHEFFMEEVDTIKLLKELHNLIYLSIKYCTHYIIECMAENCTFIEVLVLYNAEEIKEASIHLLIQFPHLRSVSLIDTTLCDTGIINLILSEINIEAIEPYDNALERCIENIVSNKENAGKHFKLNSYSNEFETTLEQATLVCKMCPQIQKVKFTKLEVLPYFLTALYNLQNLHELKLINYGFYDDHINELLHVRGCNLVCLYLQRVCQMDINALMCIKQMCPNLESLTLTSCNFDKQSTSDSSRHLVLESPPFINLKKLFLRNQNVDPTDDQWFLLLSSCPNVEIMRVDFHHFTKRALDNFMLRVMDINPMIHLKDMSLNISREGRHALVPMLFISRIIQNCINTPKISVN